jgi:hypothetical protein
LDDGLRLYRRNLPSFLLVGSAILVPMAGLGILFATLVRTELGQGWAVAGGLILGLIQYPILLYACLALSRAAGHALAGQPIKLGSVLRLRPLRALGMGCYSVVLAIVSGLFSSVLVISVACPLLYAMLFGAGFLGSLGGSSILGAAGSLFGVIFSLIALSSLLLTSATFATLAYAVQAFALEDRTVGSAISRSIDLLLFRLGRNLLVFVGAGAIIGTLLIAYAGTILAGGAGLLRLLDVEPSPIVAQALSSAVTTATWVLLLPPLPIWMAMLHRALAEERDGTDLIAAVEHWRTGIPHT